MNDSKETWTKAEVRELVEPLLDQIEFYQGKYHRAEKFIAEYHSLPFWKRWFYGNVMVIEYSKQSIKENEESTTLIERFVNSISKL